MYIVRVKSGKLEFFKVKELPGNLRAIRKSLKVGKCQESVRVEYDQNVWVKHI